MPQKGDVFLRKGWFLLKATVLKKKKKTGKNNIGNDAEFNQHKQSNSMVSRRCGESRFKEITGLSSLKPTNEFTPQKKNTKNIGFQGRTFLVSWGGRNVAVADDIPGRCLLSSDMGHQTHNPNPWRMMDMLISIQFSHSFLAASFYEFQCFSRWEQNRHSKSLWEEDLLMMHLVILFSRMTMHQMMSGSIANAQKLAYNGNIQSFCKTWSNTHLVRIYILQRTWVENHSIKLEALSL